MTAGPGAGPGMTAGPGAGPGMTAGPGAGPGMTAGPAATGALPVPPVAGGMPAHPYSYQIRLHGLALASPGARLLARLVDIVAVVLLNVFANGWLAYKLWQVSWPVLREETRRWLSGENPSGSTIPDEGNWLVLAIAFVALAVWFAYEVPATANGGQTLGKWLLGVRVMRLESPDRLGLRRSWRRWRTMATPSLFWCCGLGFVLQAVDCLFVVIDRPLNQAIHDKAGQTVVVRIHRKGAHREPSDPR
jgi:uncharacterized RDD family membrane protein YckC